MAAVYIVEGVPGSGKDTLCAQLIDHLDPASRDVQVFPEEAALASWVHYFVPGIHDTRVTLVESLVSHVEDFLRRDPDACFVFNRLHVSHAVWRREFGSRPDLEARHDQIAARLRQLPVTILHSVLGEQEAERRVSHVEREELAWRNFLKRRVEHAGESTAGTTFTAQQAVFTEIMEADGVPFVQVKVTPGTRIDFDKLLDGGGMR